MVGGFGIQKGLVHGTPRAGGNERAKKKMKLVSEDWDGSGKMWGGSDRERGMTMTDDPRAKTR